VQVSSEYDFITCIRIIELEGLLLFGITCCLCSITLFICKKLFLLAYPFPVCALFSCGVFFLQWSPILVWADKGARDDCQDGGDVVI